MTTDIDTLIVAIRSEANIADRPGSMDRLNAIADALVFWQTTTREKLMHTFGSTYADAILAADIFTDANKIAADAWDEGFKTGATAALAGFSRPKVNPYRAPVTAPTETEKP